MLSFIEFILFFFESKTSARLIWIKHKNEPKSNGDKQMFSSLKPIKISILISSINFCRNFFKTAV